MRFLGAKPALWTDAKFEVNHILTGYMMPRAPDDFIFCTEKTENSNC